jgi:hypothetical protein
MMLLATLVSSMKASRFGSSLGRRSSSMPSPPARMIIASLGTLKLVERRLNSATRRIRSLTIASAQTGWAAISRSRAAHTCSSTQGKQRRVVVAFPSPPAD